MSMKRFVHDKKKAPSIFYTLANARNIPVVHQQNKENRYNSTSHADQGTSTFLMRANFESKAYSAYESL